ncbi:hypothetical protein GCK72_016738 [Caenorhabditis remanei]|uniref:Zinc metalloproteinase n=1 Tax=Caenorhabditis remanei TaxID=31234 RepID=A0A6A5G666_CAERE|nr:hypothetical protein GCK72_016738 [Caenorhabditis remanei]KAF1750191.1 hypothetical protein GCK72_016738 [Caenorhabditis remanei]
MRLIPDLSMSEAVLRAMELISTHTCIKFSTEPSDVMIRMESDPTQNFCYAEIGHVRPHQKFSFVSACYSSGAAAHELIHSLGFIHTHQRSDRDQYLDFKMNLEDMTPDMRDQYKIYEGQTLYVPYDYGSVMHYPDESGNYYPIEKNIRMTDTMGTEMLAFYDYLMINKYYECSCDTDLKCQNNGYPNPANCSQCNCPYGYGGDDCSRRAEPGQTVIATLEPQTVTIKLDAGFRNGDERQVDFIYSYLWIEAPANKSIVTRIELVSKEKCVPGCSRGGLEIKINDDDRLTSRRFCCGTGQFDRSFHSPTIVMAYNSVGMDEYIIHYRHDP